MSDTIAALATAPGLSGVAVVRVSGPDAFSVMQAIAQRPAVAGRFVFTKLKSKTGEVIDEALVLAFKSPHSYTGEDVVEFQCHGGSVTPRRVLDAVFEAGARLARRGEFTQRAFLNGRLDYEKAAAVLDLIESKTSAAADDALERLGGKRHAEYKALYEEALALSTTLEHSLDVDESDIDDEFIHSCDSALKKLSQRLEKTIINLKRGRVMQEGTLVVLAGPPNAGKSSLMNALLGEDRAIVSPVAGTTRDTIEQWLDIGGYPVRLVDTAGLREASDEIEAEGVVRAKNLIERADLVLAINTDIEGALKIHSKCDLSRGEGLNVSSLTKEGLEELKAAIAKRLGEIEPKADVSVLDKLMAAKNALDGAFSAIDSVVIANSVRMCAESLADVIGARYSSDMLDRLFSRFCVGK